MDGANTINSVSLRPANKDDLPTIETWLNKDYIKKWYEEPEESKEV